MKQTYYLAAPPTQDRPQDDIIPALPPGLRGSARVDDTTEPDADWSLTLEGPGLPAPHRLACWLDGYCPQDEGWAVWLDGESYDIGLARSSEGV